MDISRLKNNGQRCRPRILQVGLGFEGVEKSPPSLWDWGKALLYIHRVTPKEAVTFLFLKCLILKEIYFNTVKLYLISARSKGRLTVNHQIKMSHDAVQIFLQPINHILNLMSKRHDVSLFYKFTYFWSQNSSISFDYSTGTRYTAWPANVKSLFPALLDKETKPF